MIACLIIDVETWNKSDSKVESLALGIQTVDLSIIPHKAGLLCLQMKVEDENQLWQLALNLEFKDVMTGYGFGSTFSEAKSAAIQIMDKRMNSQDHKIAPVNK